MTYKVFSQSGSLLGFYLGTFDGESLIKDMNGEEFSIPARNLVFRMNEWAPDNADRKHGNGPFYQETI